MIEYGLAGNGNELRICHEELAGRATNERAQDSEKVAGDQVMPLAGTHHGMELTTDILVAHLA